jgi:hypothetical protein
MMATIYENAEQVVVWPGRIDHELELSLNSTLTSGKLQRR